MMNGFRESTDLLYTLYFHSSTTPPETKVHLIHTMGVILSGILLSFRDLISRQIASGFILALCRLPYEIKLHLINIKYNNIGHVSTRHKI